LKCKWELICFGSITWALLMGRRPIIIRFSCKVYGGTFVPPARLIGGSLRGNRTGFTI